MKLPERTAPARHTVVTPYAGVWIEILQHICLFQQRIVTPYAGVWIEIDVEKPREEAVLSLPTRECGLKSITHITQPLFHRHSLRGSVD